MRQSQVGQHAGEAEAVNQAEGEGEQPAAGARDDDQIVERSDDDRRRDRRLDPSRWQLYDVPRGERKGDRVGERKRGDHLGDIPESVPETFGTRPCSVDADQDRRQEQRQQEQKVIETEPDMPDAVRRIVDELTRQASFGDFDSLHRGSRTEDCRARLPGVFETQQPSVLGIDVEEQAIAGSQRVRRGRACRREAQHRISAVAVLVDLVSDDARRAGPWPSAAKSSRASA